MLCKGEVWCLRQNELDILEKTQTALMRKILRTNLLHNLRMKYSIDKVGLKKKY